jgi:hypothetical protein
MSQELPAIYVNEAARSVDETARSESEDVEKEPNKEETRRRMESAHNEYVKIRDDFRSKNPPGSRLSKTVLVRITQEYGLTKDQVRRGLRMKECNIHNLPLATPAPCPPSGSNKHARPIDMEFDKQLKKEVTRQRVDSAHHQYLKMQK